MNVWCVDVTITLGVTERYNIIMVFMIFKMLIGVLIL